MRFTERKEFIADPALFRLADSQTALKIYDECVRVHTARPMPRFFEVDREGQAVDPLWHSPTGTHTLYTRELDIPALNKFIKPDWKLTSIGVVPQRRDDFIIAHNTLEKLDYFPLRGDRVYWNGYRYMILQVVLDSESYWQQTNVWMGLRVECVVVPEGDARPNPDQSTRSPAETSPRKGF